MHILAYEETVEEKTALNTLFIKMGITSLTKDFELEKENILQNTNDIEELKKQVQYLLQENMKLKLQVKDSVFSDENKSIQEQLVSQKQVIETPKKQLKQIYYKSSDESILRKAVISLASASIVETPYPNAKTIATLNKDTLIKITSCDRYGWCKLYERDGYIAMYKLRFLP